LKQKIVIFGAGQAGVAALKNLQAKYLPVAFCDNDANKVGTELASLPIICPQELQSTEFDLLMIASEYFEQITLQLKSDFAIPSERIKVLNASQIKSFHFGDSQSAKDKAEQVLFTLCDALMSCGIKHHIDAGTLLGIYRDRMNKERILYALQSITQTSWQCTELFAANDFGLVAQGTTRSFKLEPIEKNKGLPLIDLFVKYLGETTMDYVISSRGFSMPSEHMRSIDRHSFKGQQLCIPSNVEAYLSNHYGDWQTPNPNWTLEHIKSATVFELNH
jgi:lipopolysaccharide cholinephosphotransferase